FVPHALRTGSWLHHIKSIRRDGTVRDALYLRLSAATVDRLGLLQALHGDRGRLGDPWHPGGDPHVRLAAGQSIGLGLHRSHLTPDLTSRLITAMGLAGNQTAVEKIHASLTEPGLGDPMLNRRRLEYLFSPDGIARHLPSMADGGASALHVKPGRLTQHSRDLRVIAEPIGPPELVGFLPDHDDLDVKTTHVADRSHREQRAHGHTTMAGVAGTGVTNQQGENLALGAGDAIAFSTQIANAQESGRSSVRSDLSSARGVKARIRIPTRFSLVVYDQGRKIPTPLLTVDDAVVQDRWAGDLRLPRPRADAEVPTPVPYRIGVPDSLPPGWADTNGVPLPSRFSAEDLNQIAELQKTVEKMLSGEAKRLAEAGYAGAHQIHAGLSPEMLLPGVPAMLSPGGLDLPAVTSAQILGQRAEINIRLLPESASLGSVSSGVFREHVTQENAGRSAGTNRVTQSSRMPQVPIVGRGYADDPYQALELGGPGAVSGDATVAAETQNMTAADGANVKPESRSAAVDLLSRVVVTIKLPKPLADLFGTTRIVLSPAAADRSMVRLRMGLHDARTVLSLPEAAAGADQPARAAEFDRLVVQEAALNRAAGGFQRAADALAEARYEGHADPDGSTGARAAAEARLPGLLDAVDRTGEIWWKLAQEHFRLVDQFRHRYIGVSTTVTGTGEPVALARLLRQITLDTVLPVPAPPVPPLVPVPPVPTPEPPVPVPVPPVPVPPVPLAPVVEAPEVEVIADPPVVVTPELEIVADPPGGSTAGLEVVVVPAVVVSSEVTEPLGSRVPPGLVQRIAGGLKTSGPAREIDGVLVIGEPADWQARETTLRTMIDRLAASGLPAIVVDGDLLARGERAAGAPGRIREGLEPTALNAALRAFDRAGVRPVVVATGRSERLTRLADAHEVVSIVGVPTDLGHSWQLSGPSGVPVGAPAELGPDLLAEAGRRAAEPVEATVGGPPEVLQEWLAAPDWAAAGDYLTEHLAELNTPEVTAALQAMRADAPTDRELGAYQAVQELAQQAGPGQPADAFVPRPEGVGESSGGFVAQSDAVGEPDGASVPRPGAVGDLALPEGPLSPSFALHYLTPVQGYEQRAPWNDQLLRVLYERRLSPDRTVDLARGLLARDGPDVSRSVDPAVTNAMVFEAVAKVLALTPEQAADVNNTAFREALKLVEDCVVTPTDRWLWILRLGWLRDRMQKDGVTHLDALIRVLTETLSNC
ncbi:MAG TPA: hypothetical protein VN408_05750, partial [Actinoplanes sp.]|nr:hypothetical protein [Actinoplanes sp.]